MIQVFLRKPLANDAAVVPGPVMTQFRDQIMRVTAVTSDGLAIVEDKYKNAYKESHRGEFQVCGHYVLKRRFFFWKYWKFVPVIRKSAVQPSAQALQLDSHPRPFFLNIRPAGGAADTTPPRRERTRTIQLDERE